MKPTKTRTAYGPRRTRFDSAPAERIDESCWIRPERQPVTITLPVISITATPLSDEDLDHDLGLSTNPWDRRAAERAITASRARHRAN